tara:strand:- start:2024 stop:2770 length:747 start_codon:yes stop_codon:yes gene_type:complete
MTQKEQLTKEDLVADILGSVPEEVEVEVELPSRCLFYTLDDPSKSVTIRPMTFEDERGLASMGANQTGKSLDYLISRCTSNINVNHLLDMDKMFILMKIREISYGESFNADIECPKCKESQSISLDISKLQVNKVPEDFKDPREVHLPVCNKKAVVRFPRSADTQYVSTPDGLAINMWRFVESINDCTDKKVISDVLQKLPLRDMHSILEGLNQTDYGVQTKFLYLCEGCNSKTQMEVPFNETFFTMS